MSLVIDLPHPVAVRLQAEAAKAGISAAEFVADLIQKSIPAQAIDPEEQKRLNAPSIALLEAWLAEAQKPRTPEEIAEAESDMKQLMQSLNSPRREAGERLHFPNVEEAV